MNYFSHEITRHIATLSTSGSIQKELNIVSFNGGEPKYDIRSWMRKASGEVRPLRGVTLTESELEALKEALGRL